MKALFGYSFVSCCLLWLTGCGVAPSPSYGKLSLLSVSGTVTLDGQPLPEAVVTFDADDGQFSYGRTDSAGRFSLQFDSVKAGVTPGKKIVRISTTRKLLGLNTVEEEGEESRPEGAATPAARPAELVPDRYNKKSELVADVTPDKTRFDFPLSSK
ncbi:MAG: carboxypeptidase-like regulatory domain-containing protein [Planctomycetaceae bacterium]